MRHNIYIRKEDEVQWNTLSNKAEFIHQALLSQNPTLRPQVMDKVKKIQEANNLDYCEHGYGVGLCKYDKCNRKSK